MTLAKKIDYNTCTNLQYYPLLEKGDRFPLNNPDLEPKLSPALITQSYSYKVYSRA